MSKSESLGTEPIGRLLAKQAIPAAIGFAVMSLNMIVDTIFVGKYIGELAIGAISIVVPISFFMSSFGMSIGMGGASIVSRAMGAGDKNKAQLAFNNQITLTFIFISLFLVLGLVFKDGIINLYGASGSIRSLTDIYYTIVMYGVPFLSLSMMANNNLRAEGKANIAMLALLIPSGLNMILDWIFIMKLGYGMEGAAWATTISYFVTGVFMAGYFLSGKSELKVTPSLFPLKWYIVKEIFIVGSVSLIRQTAISILTIVLNAMLLKHGAMIPDLGGEKAISVYGIATRVSMFVFFPLIGIAQGFVPIVGYNYGAKKYDRVYEAVRLSSRVGLLIASILALMLLLGAEYVPMLFTEEQDLALRKYTPDAIFIIFMATPLLVYQLIGASFYQALGKGVPALLLTLTKQLFFLTPFAILLPPIFGLKGIWYAFPIADVLSAAVCFYYLRRGVKKLKEEELMNK